MHVCVYIYIYIQRERERERERERVSVCGVVRGRFEHFAARLNHTSCFIQVKKDQNLNRNLYYSPKP